MDATITEYKLLPASPKEGFLFYDNVKLKGYTFPVDTNFMFRKFTIDLLRFQWRFSDQVVYHLELREGDLKKRIEICYKYIWKTFIQEKDNEYVKSVYPDSSKLSTIETYLYNDELVEVGMSLIDDMMNKIRKEYEI